MTAKKAKKAQTRKERKKNGSKATQFKKGNSGRPKGTKNKTPALLVQKIVEIEGTLTLEGKGLLDCARQDPAWFYEKILVKVLPKNIDLGTQNNKPLKVELIDSYKIPDADPA